MIGGLKPYAEYKGSGQKWLGSIPAHWNVRRTKLILREVDSRSTTGKEQLLRVSQYTGVTQRKPTDGSESPDTRAASLVGYKRVTVNDLVINIMLAWNGSMGVSRYDGIASPAYCVYRLNRGAHPWYFHELFRLPLYKGRIKAASTGVIESRLRLYSDDLGRIEAILPPPDEQAAIVRFLDHANRKIDGFIRAKRKLIGLLNEQKQAIIHRAVTRGLDPNVPLKPSGIPWLGDIPEHWEVMQLRQVISFGPKNGVSPQAASGAGVLSFSISAVRDGRINIEGNEKFVELESTRIPVFRIQKGDILIVRGNGNVALVGKCGLVDSCPENCVYPDILMKVRPNEKMRAEFMVLAINSSYVTNQVSTLAKTSNGAFKVSGATVRSILMVVPPHAEQIEVIDKIVAESTKVTTAITRTEREIALMQEYRTRLIADIVTGKLDVREAATKLPDPPIAVADSGLDESLEEGEAEEE